MADVEKLHCRKLAKKYAFGKWINDVGSSKSGYTLGDAQLRSIRAEVASMLQFGGFEAKSAVHIDWVKTTI